MAALLDITRDGAEESLIITWSGMPASWRWRGRMHELAVLHAQWEDSLGRTWYRVESEEGLLFLLGRDRNGWTAALWQGTPQEKDRRASARRCLLRPSV